MTRFWRALVSLVLLPLLFLAADAGRARAGDPVGNVPHDAPIILEPHTVKLPPLAADMTTETHGWLRISYPTSVKEKVDPLVAEADTFKAYLEDRFDQDVLSDVEVRVARSPADMEALAPIGHPPPAYAVGVAYSPLHLVLLSLTAPKTAEADDLGETFRHELTHVAIFDAFAGHHVPLWFNEGLAVEASGELAWQRNTTLWNATLSDAIIPLDDLDKSFPDENYQVSIAYAQSADFVRFLLRGEDRARFQSLVARVRNGQAFDRSLADAYGTDLRRLEYEWHEDLSKRFSLWPVVTGSAFLWGLIVVIFVVAWVKRRRRAKETLARWAREEAEEDRLRALAAETALPDEVVVMRPSSPPQPQIHRDGRWHTLH